MVRQSLSLSGWGGSLMECVLWILWFEGPWFWRGEGIGRAECKGSAAVMTTKVDRMKFARRSFNMRPPARHRLGELTLGSGFMSEMRGCDI
jgi:hypothetical protein